MAEGGSVDSPPSDQLLDVKPKAKFQLPGRLLEDLEAGIESLGNASFHGKRLTTNLLSGQLRKLGVMLSKTSIHFKLCIL